MIQRKCKAITLKGKRCQNTREINSDYCHSHRKYIPKRFELLKLYRVRIEFGVIITIILFFIQLLISPSKEFVHSEHNITRDSIENLGKRFDELSLLVKKLLELPRQNNSKVENTDSYLAKKVDEYIRMDSILNINKEILEKTFPNGYALFSCDESGVLLPLNGKPKFKSLNIDWEKTKIKKLTKTKFQINLPDFTTIKSGRKINFSNNLLGERREKHVIFSGYTIMGIEPLVMILEDYETQIIFVISYNLGG